MPMPQGPEAILKQMAWERAKGELRACLVAMIAAEPLSSDDDKLQRENWLEFSDAVDAFISDVEDRGLNER